MWGLSGPASLEAMAAPAWGHPQGALLPLRVCGPGGPAAVEGPPGAAPPRIRQVRPREGKSSTRASAPQTVSGQPNSRGANLVVPKLWDILENTEKQTCDTGRSPGYKEGQVPCKESGWVDENRVSWRLNQKGKRQGYRVLMPVNGDGPGEPDAPSPTHKGTWTPT